MRSVRCAVRKSSRFTVSSCSSMASTFTAPSCSICCAQLLGFGAQRVVVEVERLGVGDHLVERLAPLGLEPLANGRRGGPTSSVKRSSAWCSSSASGAAPRARARSSACSASVSAASVGAHAAFGRLQALLRPSASVGWRASRSVLPGGHLLGELGVAARAGRPARRSALQARGGRAAAPRQAVLAVGGHLGAGLRLRLLHLRTRSAVSRARSCSRARPRRALARALADARPRRSASPPCSAADARRA